MATIHTRAAGASLEGVSHATEAEGEEEEEARPLTARFRWT